MNERMQTFIDLLRIRDGRDGDGALRNSAVFPSHDNLEFFKSSQSLETCFNHFKNVFTRNYRRRDVFNRMFN